MLNPSYTLRLYYFAAFAAMGVFLPYLPGWLEARGITGFRMGLVVAVRPAAMILSPILFGLLADALGARGTLLRWACLGALASTGLLGALMLATEPGFFTVFALLLLFSVLRAPLSSVADATTLEARPIYGTVRLWGSLGFLVAALLAGRWVDLTAPAGFPLAITAALCVAWLATFLVPPKSAAPPRPIRAEAARLLKRREFQLLLALIAGWQLSHSAYDLCISLHLRDLGASSAEIGIARAIGTLAEVVLMAFSGLWTKRYSAISLLLVGLGGTSLRWAAIAWAPSLTVALMLQPLHALSFGLVWIASMQVLKRQAEPHIMATAQGLLAGALAIGSSAGLLLWGELYEQLTARPVFLGTTVVSVAVLLAALALRRASSSEPTQTGVISLTQNSKS